MDRLSLERLGNDLEAALGSPKFEELKAEGAALTLEAAAELALQQA
jgi:hypothetical protein